MTGEGKYEHASGETYTGQVHVDPTRSFPFAGNDAQPRRGWGGKGLFFRTSALTRFNLGSRAGANVLHLKDAGSRFARRRKQRSKRNSCVRQATTNTRTQIIFLYVGVVVSSRSLLNLSEGSVWVVCLEIHQLIDQTTITVGR